MKPMADETSDEEDEPWYPTEAEWSLFEERLGISDSYSSHLEKLSDSSSGTREFDKICVLVGCYSRDTDTNINPPRDVYRVYCVDVNSSSTSKITPLEPIIVWDISDIGHSAFAILGSYLYMFGGFHNDGKRCYWRSDMSYYDMRTALSSSTTSTTTLLHKESLQTGPEMSGRKAHPVAVVIDDSKICVFSTQFYLRDYQSHLKDRPSFELFDTRNHTWKPLPELTMKSENVYDDLQSIQSYCVHRGSCLIIQVIEKGIFGININNPDPKWVTLDRSVGKPFLFEGKWTMVDNMLCNPFSVMRRAVQRPYPIRLDSRNQESLVSVCHMGGALCFDDRFTNLCIFRAAVPYPDYSSLSYVPPDYPHLAVDILKFDNEALEKLQHRLSKWQEVHRDKSFTFTLPSCVCDRFEFLACFPIKNAKMVAEVDQGKMKKKRKRKRICKCLKIYCQGRMKKRKRKSLKQ